jgi:hypothetical protein
MMPVKTDARRKNRPSQAKWIGKIIFYPLTKSASPSPPEIRCIVPCCIAPLLIPEKIPFPYICGFLGVFSVRQIGYSADLLIQRTFKAVSQMLRRELLHGKGAPRVRSA